MPTGLGSGRARRWYSAAAVTAGLGVLAGGAALVFSPGAAPGKRGTADACGLVACGASLPAQGTSATAGNSSASATPSGRQRHSPMRTPSPTTKTASPTPAPTGSPPPSSPPPGRAVTVTYSPDRHGRRISGTLTLVNHSRESFSKWTITLTFPGDQIDFVGAPGDSLLAFDTWHFSGDTLTLSAVLSSETLRPGATEQILITGHGPTASPSGCQFDGSACNA